MAQGAYIEVDRHKDCQDDTHNHMGNVHQDQTADAKEVKNLGPVQSQA